MSILILVMPSDELRIRVALFGRTFNINRESPSRHILLLCKVSGLPDLLLRYMQLLKLFAWLLGIMISRMALSPLLNAKAMPLATTGRAEAIAMPELPVVSCLLNVVYAREKLLGPVIVSKLQCATRLHRPGDSVIDALWTFTL